MFVIRKEQMKILKNGTVTNFENQMLAHLNKVFPAVCDAMTETEIRRVVRYGMEQAKSYVIVRERDICKYIDLMFVFGKDFDKDPLLPWAYHILNTECEYETPCKIDRLYSKAMDFADQAGGIDPQEKKIR